MAVALVSLAAAKTHLRIDTLDADVDVQMKVDQASAVVRDYLKGRNDDAWTESSAPPPVQAATLMLVAHFYEHRGDDMALDDKTWAAVERLLVRFRDPALA